MSKTTLSICLPEEVTARQAQVLDFLRSSIKANGMPPTRAEIAGHFNWASANSAEEHLATLERKGLVDLSRGRARGIRLTRTGAQICATHPALNRG